MTLLRGSITHTDLPAIFGVIGYVCISKLCRILIEEILFSDNSTGRATEEEGVIKPGIVGLNSSLRY
jgi:hypothetical protein